MSTVAALFETYTQWERTYRRGKVLEQDVTPPTRGTWIVTTRSPVVEGKRHGDKARAKIEAYEGAPGLTRIEFWDGMGDYAPIGAVFGEFSHIVIATLKPPNEFTAVATGIAAGHGGGEPPRTQKVLNLETPFDVVYAAAWQFLRGIDDPSIQFDKDEQVQGALVVFRYNWLYGLVEIRKEGVSYTEVRVTDPPRNDFLEKSPEESADELVIFNQQDGLRKQYETEQQRANIIEVNRRSQSDVREMQAHHDAVTNSLLLFLQSKYGSQHRSDVESVAPGVRSLFQAPNNTPLRTGKLSQKSGRPSYPDDTWAIGEIKSGRNWSEVFNEWRNRPGVVERNLAEPRETFRKNVRRKSEKKE